MCFQAINRPLILSPYFDITARNCTHVSLYLYICYTARAIGGASSEGEEKEKERRKKREKEEKERERRGKKREKEEKRERKKKKGLTEMLQKGQV